MWYDPESLETICFGVKRHVQCVGREESQIRGSVLGSSPWVDDNMECSVKSLRQEGGVVPNQIPSPVPSLEDGKHHLIVPMFKKNIYVK